MSGNICFTLKKSTQESFESKDVWWTVFLLLLLPSPWVRRLLPWRRPDHPQHLRHYHRGILHHHRHHPSFNLFCRRSFSAEATSLNLWCWSWATWKRWRGPRSLRTSSWFLPGSSGSTDWLDWLQFLPSSEPTREFPASSMPSPTSSGEDLSLTASSSFSWSSTLAWSSGSWCWASWRCWSGPW